MSHDPADTLSAVLPSLPPPPPRDDGGELTVLDPRFPIQHTEPAKIFWQQISEWPDRETVISETIRATRQHDRGEVRFVRPLPPIAVGPAALPPPPPVPYQDLTPEVREREFDTLTGTAVLFAEEEPGRHRHRGSNGRFVSAGGT